MRTLYDEGQTERFFMASFDLTRTRMGDRFAQLRFFFVFFSSPLRLVGLRGRGSLFFFFWRAPRGGARRFGVGSSNAAKMRRVQHKCEYWG